MPTEQAEALKSQGNTHYREGRHQKALECFIKATVEDESYTTAWFNAGLCYKQLNQPQKAIQAFNKVLELDKGHDKALNNLIDLLSEIPKTEATIPIGNQVATRYASCNS